MKDGLHAWCNDCRKAYCDANRDKLREKKREYYQANRETILADKREYFQTHKEQHRTYQRQQRASHGDEIRAYRRQWRAHRRDDVCAYQRRYYAENRPKMRAYLRAWRERNIHKEREYALHWRTRYPDTWKALRIRRRAVSIGLPGSITAQQWRECLDYWQHRCAVCGRSRGLWLTIAADHWIPISSPSCPGSVSTNIVPLCHGRSSCNIEKGNKPPVDWLTAKLGKRKARRKLVEIEAYFDRLRILTQDKA